jgi:hypothetical protein
MYKNKVIYSEKLLIMREAHSGYSIFQRVTAHIDYSERIIDGEVCALPSGYVTRTEGLYWHYDLFPDKYTEIDFKNVTSGIGEGDHITSIICRAKAIQSAQRKSKTLKEIVNNLK